MNKIYILFLLKIVTALPYDCADFTSLGCNGCVVNFESVTSGCVWCGSVDDNGNSPNGICYNYSIISSACQNTYTEDDNMQNYQCCGSIYRIGSNTEFVCSADFSDEVQSFNFKLAILIISYFWATGFVAVFTSNTLYDGNYFVAFYRGLFYPYFFVKLFFNDIK